jgi:hypothetical protein
MVIEDDEIAIIAKVTMAMGGRYQEAIDGNIANAKDAGRWDEVNKWHRVRLRIDRMQRQMTRSRPMEFRAVRPSLSVARS